MITLGGGLIKYLADAVLRQIQEGVPILAKDATKYFVIEKINELRKKIAASKGSGIILSNNGLKDIIKVIESLEKKRNFIERDDWKGYKSKKRITWFINESWFTIYDTINENKKCFVTITSNRSNVRNRCSYSIKKLWVRHDCRDNFKQRNKDIPEIVKHLLRLGTWAVSLLGSMLSVKGVIWAGERVIQAGEGAPAMNRASSFN